MEVWAIRAGNTLAAGADRALYVGELPATGWHRHAAPVLLLGLSGRFALQLHPGLSVTCHSAILEAGVEHLFDPRGEQVAILYLEPDAPEARGLRVLLRRHGGLLLDPARAVGARSAMQTRLLGFDLPALLPFGWPEAAPVDPRVRRSLQLLRSPLAGPMGRGTASAAAHLSASRFNHLFRQEMGVSFRSYRVWSQLRAAMLGLGADLNLTQAALQGAFSDSAHFSRTFRNTFGMTPSSVLKPLAQIRRV